MSPYRINARPPSGPRLSRVTVAGVCVAMYALGASTWLTLLNAVVSHGHLEDTLRVDLLASHAGILCAGIFAALGGGAPRTRVRLAATATLLLGYAAIPWWRLEILAWFALTWLALELRRVTGTAAWPSVAGAIFGAVATQDPFASPLLRVAALGFFTLGFFLMAKAARDPG